MIKNLIKISVTMLCCAFLSLNASAASNISATIDLAKQEVTVSGVFDAITEKTNFTLVILNPNFIRTDITYDNFDVAVNHCVQLKTEDDGSFTYSYKMEGEMGEYTAFAVLEETDAPVYAPEGFFYYDIEDLDAIAQEIDKLTVLGATSVYQEIKDKYQDIFPTSSDEELNAISDYIVKDRELNGGFTNFSKLQNAYVSYFPFAELKATTNADDVFRVLSSLEENKPAISFLRLSAYDAYKNILSSEKQKEILEKLAGLKNTRHIKDYEDKFNELTILSATKNMSSYRYMKSLLDKNRTILIGVDYSAYDELCQNDINHKVDANLVGKNFETLTAFEQAINAEILLASKIEESSSGGSGGGGGNYFKIPASPSEVTPEDDMKEVEQPEKLFNDVSNEHWAYTSVLSLVKKGAVNGKTENSFAPDDLVTREEFVKMVILAMDIKGESKEITFYDVQKSDWCYPYIVTACSKGLINGESNENFGTGKNITREDMAVIICRILELREELVFNNVEFKDDAAISSYAYDSIGKLVRIGVISGMSDGTFQPKQNATRAQAAKMLHSVMLREGV